MLLSRAPLRQLVFRYVAMTAAALLVVLVYRSILHVNQTTVALTFLVMVQLVAFGWGLVYSVCLSIGCTLLYNFFFLPPSAASPSPTRKTGLRCCRFWPRRFSSAGSQKANGGRPR